MLTETGAEIQRIVAVVDRGQGASENIAKAGFVFESLLNSEDLRLPQR